MCMKATKKDISEEKFEELVAPYQDTGDAILDKTIDDVLALKADGQLSEEMAIKFIKYLIARQISQDIRTGISQTSSQGWANKSNKMQFFRIRYGKTEEHFAI